jgi:hypothetical protein
MDLTWEIYGLPIPVPEYRFMKDRRFRFDWAWPGKLIAVEIQGGIWTRGRHSRGYGQMGDYEKLNLAQALGWRVFYFTPVQLRKGEAQEFMKEVLK